MPQVQLIVTLDDNGSVNINGPIQNALLCFGLLEMAKVAINNYAEQNKRLIQPVAGVLPTQLPKP
jgi:hypothetical protein